MSVRRWLLAILLYLLIVTILLITKPAALFADNMRIKRWSAQTTWDTSIFSPQFLFPFVGILCYYIVTVLMTF